MMKKIVLLLAGTLINVSFAQLSFDRSRVIFDAGKKSSQSVVVTNSNAEAPYLANAWIENDRGEKIVSPLVALPILQRINPKQDKQIKISFMGSDAELPKDRETMLFMNVLGVPPKDDDGTNKISIVIQSKMKLFYRPKGLPTYEHNGWFEEVVAKKSGNSITLENPTPYYSVIYALTDNRNRTIEKEINLKPFSSETINIQVGNTFTMMLIDDYGGSVKMNYVCNSNLCTGSRNQGL